jgi:predicted DNA-binding protein (MmcQ/YjbR family)
MSKTPKLAGFAAEMRDFALALPEATEEFPWGERAFKVAKKAFVFLRAENEISFSVKLPKSAVQALALPFASPTHYGLGKHGWVTFVLPRRLSAVLRKQCLDWILESYVSVAPKRVSAKLSSG